MRPMLLNGGVLLALLVGAVACGERPETNAARALPTGEPIVQADTGFYQELSWAPDGSRLLLSVLEFSGEPPGYTYHIEQLAVNGSVTHTRLTDGPRDYWTSWSPDGLRVAFTSRVGENTDIYTMAADGSSRTQLTDDPASDTQPDWSSDGSKIAFVSDRDGTTRLWAMNADGSEPHTVGEPEGEAQNPAWSPDGRRIAYYETPAMGENWITVIGSDGTGRTRLAEGVWPSWSPDGSHIVFGGKDGLYLMAANGTGMTRLVAGDADYGRYSPDGSLLAYIAKQDGAITVNLMRADGTESVTLLRRPAPQW